MFKKRKMPGLFLSIYFSIIFVVGPAYGADPVVIITTSEASIPPSGKPVEVATRNLTRGPIIDVIAPSTNMSSTAPFRFSLKFKKSNDVEIDLSSLRVVYERSEPIDITPRIARYLTNSGVEIELATAPPGDHIILVEIEDKAHRKASKRFILKVAP